MRSLAPELACLDEVEPSSEVTTPRALHEAAGLVMTLKGDATDALAKACDPSSSRVEMGYAVYALAMTTIKADRMQAVALLSWTVDELGNPQAAAKLGRMHLLDEGADGQSEPNPIEAAALLGAANRILSHAGRGEATSRAAMALMQGSAAIGAHAALLRGKHHEVDARRQEVLTAFLGPDVDP